MTNFHYSPAKNWYKGSLHLHSTRSDGHLTVATLTEKYAAANFDFIALTDHWQVNEPSAQKNAPLLVLDGTELDGSDEKGVYYHVVIIGAVTESTDLTAVHLQRPISPFRLIGQQLELKLKMNTASWPGPTHFFCRKYQQIK